MIELVRDASWCWFGDSRALHYDGKVYYGWNDTRGRVWVAQYDPATGTRRRFQVGSYLNAAGVGMVDDHGNPSLVMRGGRLVVFYCYHAGGQMKYRVADAVGSVESFGPEIVCSAGNTAGGSGFTYPNPVDMTATNGQMYLFWRGGNFQPTFARTYSGGPGVAGNGWQAAKWLFSAPPGVRPYVKVLGDDPRGWIHLAMTDGHPRDVSTSIFYARFQVSDGTFRRANGGLLGTLAAVDAGNPIPVASLDLVYDGSASSGKPRGWIWDLQADPATGCPVIAFATVPSRTDHTYLVARASCTAGGGWDVTPVCPAGGSIAQDIEDQYSGGIVLDPTDLSRVVVSRAPDPAGWQQLERWVQDGAGGWSREQVLTDAGQQNVRPFFVRGAPADVPNRLMWVRGTYGTFVDFTTGLYAG